MGKQWENPKRKAGRGLLKKLFITDEEKAQVEANEAATGGSASPVRHMSYLDTPKGAKVAYQKCDCKTNDSDHSRGTFNPP